jgi:hypothetical protein
VTVAVLTMLTALVTHDFSVSYVAQVGSRSTPLFIRSSRSGARSRARFSSGRGSSLFMECSSCGEAAMRPGISCPTPR